MCNHQLILSHESRGWGIACIYAYRAYKDDKFLKIAQDIWDDKYMVTASDAQAKKHPQRDTPIASLCDQREYDLFYVFANTDVN
jgi:hypothetical protein